MNNIDITPIINGVIALIGMCVSILLIPYLKTKLTEQQRKRIKEYIDTAVQAAEKLFPKVDGEQTGVKKLEYVTDYLQSKGIYFNANDLFDDTRIMIESAVKEFAS